MNLNNKFVIALFGAFAPALFPAFAADPYSDVTDAILASDPAVRAERARLVGEIEQLRSANTLEAPEVEFGYKWGTEINKWDLSVSQGFDWPGVYGARKKAIRYRRYAMDESLKAYRLSKECDIREQLINYVAARRRLALLESYSNNIDSVYTLSQIAYEHEQMTVLDLWKVRVERELARARCVEAGNAMQTAADRIEAMNGGMAVDLSHITTYPDVTVPEYDPSSSPSLASAHWSMLAAEAEASAARRNRFPGFSVGYVHEVEGASHFNGIKVGIALPLWKGRRDNIAAKLMAEAAADAAEAKRRELRGEYDALQNQAVALTTQADALEEAIGDEGKYRELLAKALRGGTITLHEYFGELNTLLDARLAVEDFRASAALAAEQTRRYR